MSSKNSLTYTHAEDLLKLALDHNPNNEQLHSNLEALQNLQRASQVLEHHLRTACQQEPNNLQYLNNHARFLLTEGKYSEAEEHLIKAIAISPAFGESESLLMEVYHQTQHWEQLEKLAKEVIRSKTNIDHSLKYLEIAQRKKTVLTILEEETRNNPSATNHLKLSKELYVQKRYAQAFHHTSTAIQKQENLPDAQLQLGLTYYKLGESQKAIKTIKTGLHLDSDFQSIRKSLALLEDYQLESEIAYHPL
ncbi:lipopolysaccharide assembly protein LapB [Flagellimonas sp. S3867]|uniref:tetratricopeptide repeat protein n=1 Tax=Flagellimonas sp. S3867 TaxID=2768063 RepID=UPI001CC237E9|nr:hypothetical protein [Flagellimonas sp. S3867]